VKYELGDFEAASKDFKQALSIKHNYTLALVNLAASEFKLANYNVCVDISSQAIKLDPSLANAYLNRGNAKEMLRDDLGACIDWTKAAELGNEQAKSYVKECRMYNADKLK
jgi:tetratricopeptide (TPR) repeat protein